MSDNTPNLRARYNIAPTTEVDIIVKTATGTGRRKEALWVKPDLVAEVAFRAWTDDGKLRHASFMGLREGEDAADVFDIA